MPRSRNMWIEGIGNEVLYAVCAFLGMFVPMLIMVFQRISLNQRIHPESEEYVQVTRAEVNQQRAHQVHDQPASDNAADHSQIGGGGGPRMRPIRENHGQHTCPICLGTAEFAIQTNCGHIFCGLCMKTYWSHGNWLAAMTCPVCRQTVTLLLINFTHEEHNNNSDEKRQIVDFIYRYNRTFSGEPRSWSEYIRDMPTLLRHVLHEFFTVGGLMFMFRLRILIIFLAAFLYFISPLDLIPEAVFGIFGFLDDLFIILLLAIYVSLIYRQYVQGMANSNR